MLVLTSVMWWRRLDDSFRCCRWLWRKCSAGQRPANSTALSGCYTHYDPFTRLPASFPLSHAEVHFDKLVENNMICSQTSCSLESSKSCWNYVKTLAAGRRLHVCNVAEAQPEVDRRARGLCYCFRSISVSRALVSCRRTTWIVEWISVWESSIILRSATSGVSPTAVYQQRRPSVMAVSHRSRVSREDTDTSNMNMIWRRRSAVDLGSPRPHTHTHTRPTLFNRSTSTSGRRKLHPSRRVQWSGTYAVDKHNGPVNYVTPSGAAAGLDRRGPAARRKNGGRAAATDRWRRTPSSRWNMEIMLIYGAAIASGRHEAVMEE